jgi:16S rRNA processing protein RimM
MSTSSTTEPGGPPPGTLEVGRFGRPHGVRGEMYLDLVTDRTERVRPGARLWAGNWLTVRSSRPSNGRWLVMLEGVDDRTPAERLVNRSVFAEPIDDPDTWWIHDLIGAEVVEIDGTSRGTCTAVIDNPAHDLLELDSGVLVPMPFVVSVDVPDEPGRATLVTIDPPIGLFDD